MPRASRPHALTGLVRFGVRNGLAPLQERLFGMSGPLGRRPTSVNIELSARCCLRCRMCDSWKADGRGELDVAEWARVTERLRAWAGPFRLTITGGEPFMKPGIWDYLEHCTALGLPVVVITNGFCLSPKDLDRLVGIGLAQVVVSVDSLDPAVHDDIRGVGGAHGRTWEVLRDLGGRRRPFLLGSSTVIMDANVLQLGTMARALAGLGVDRVFFQPVQGGFTRDGCGHWPYDSALWPSAPERVDAGMASLLEARASGVPIVNTPEEIAAFRDYLRQGREWARPWPCPAGSTTFHCDSHGEVRMCIPYAGGIGNVREQDPAAIWEGEAARRERGAIAACRRPCTLNCNRKYTLREGIGLGLGVLRTRARRDGSR